MTQTVCGIFRIEKDAKPKRGDVIDKQEVPSRIIEIRSKKAKMM